MPIFEVSMPDGRKLAVTAPEGATADDAISYARLHHATPAKPVDPPGFLENMKNLAVSGYDNARDSFRVAMDNPEGAASVAAGMVKRQAATHQPEQLNEVKLSFQDEAQDWNDGNYLKSIGGALLEMGKQVVTNPKGMAYFGAEQAANMAAILAARYPGAIAGGKAGAALSAGNPLATAAGAFIGGAATGGAAEYNLEAGSAALQGLIKRAGDAGIDVSDAEAFKAFARSKPNAWSESVAEARDKGIWTTLVDQAMMSVSGRIASAPTRQAQRQAAAEIVGANTKLLADNAVAKQIALRADEILKTQGLMPRVKNLGLATGNEMLGGMASEYAGQKAAYGDPDMEEVFLEGLGELVTGPVEALSTAREAIKANRYARQPGENSQLPGDQPQGGTPPNTAPPIPPYAPFAGSGAAGEQHIPTQGGALARPSLEGEYLPAGTAVSGDVLGPESLPPGQRLLPSPPIEGEMITDPAQFARPALPAPEDGGPSERQIATARGLLNHSPKASPDLLMRLMRVDSTMAGMLFNDWRQKSESTAFPVSVIPQDGIAPFRDAEQGAPGAVMQPSQQPSAGEATTFKKGDTVRFGNDTKVETVESVGHDGWVYALSGAAGPADIVAHAQKPKGIEGTWGGYLSDNPSPSHQENVARWNAELGKVGADQTPQQNPEASRNNLVAESQAPAPSEPGDSGVAPTQDVAAPAITRIKGGKLELTGYDETEVKEAAKKLKLDVRVGADGKMLVTGRTRTGEIAPVPVKAENALKTALVGKDVRAPRPRTFTGNLRNDLNILAPGLFGEVERGGDGEATGKFDVGMIAESLRDEYGYTQIGNHGDSKAAGEALIDLIRQGGAVNEERMLAEKEAEDARVQRVEVEQFADEYGIKYRFRKFEDVLADVKSEIAKDVESAKRGVKALGEDAIRRKVMTRDEAIALVADARRVYATDRSLKKELNGWQEAANTLLDKINDYDTRAASAESGEQNGEAGAGLGESRATGSVDQGDRSEDRPAFDLRGQTRADLAAKAARENDESLAERERIKAESEFAADKFTLQAQEKPVEVREAENLRRTPSLFGSENPANTKPIESADKIAGKPVAEMTEDQLRTIARGLSPTYGEAAVDKAKAELRRRTAAPIEQKTPADAGVSVSEPSININDLNSGRYLVDNIKKKIGEWVAAATNNGARPMDRKWERTAVKRFIDANIATHLQGKQTGARAAAKIAIAKSDSFDALTLAVEKMAEKVGAGETATEFIKAPDGSIDFGEITADQAKAMRRQAGKIRLERGWHDHKTNNGSGLVHIEERRGKQIRSAGYATVEDFVLDAVRHIDSIWKPGTTSQIIAIQSGNKGKVMYLELMPARDESGDYYRVNSAFFADDSYTDGKEKKEGWKELWSRVPVPASAHGEQSDFASAPSKADGASSMVRGQSSSTNIADPQAEGNTEDSGEELSYNRRNRAGRLTWGDIKDQEAALRIKEVTKAKVYPKPDYAELADEIGPVKAHLVKQVYDKIAAKPQTGRDAPTDAQLEAYIDSVNRVMDVAIAWAKDAVFESQWRPTANGKALVEALYPEGWRAQRDEINLLGGNRYFGGVQPGYDEIKRAEKDIAKGWPGKREAWQTQGYRVVETAVDVKLQEGQSYEKKVYYLEVGGRYSGIVPSKADGEKLIADLQPWLLLNKNGRIVSQHQTEEDAIEAARNATKRGGNGGGVSDKGIAVENAERIGPARRMEGENITSDKLKETFGFRGVNFGTWMKGKANEAERQLHLNHAYDAFLDLAEILGVPPQAMSLNGMLGLAIGAQGNGKAAAHFVPGVNEINLTRTSGAGSLAHEFGHALDHYFARLGGLDRQSAPFLTEHTGRPAQGELRPEILDKFKAIVKAMNERPMTQEGYAARQRETIERMAKGIDGWLNAIRRDFESAAIQKVTIEDGKKKREKALEKFDALVKRIRDKDLGDGRIAISRYEAVSPVVMEIRELYKETFGKVMPKNNTLGLQSNIDSLVHATAKQDADKSHVPQMVKTDYARNATALDKDKGGKPYWSTDLEKFARAFDAFVTDTLEAKAAKNSYLSHAGREGDTVPAGEERKAINEAFKALVDTIETKQTDSGVAMFNAKSGARGNPIDAAALESTIASVIAGSPSHFSRDTVVAVPLFADLPAPILAKAKNEGYDANGRKPNGEKLTGATYDGKVYLVQENISSELEAEETLLHERIHQIVHGNAKDPDGIALRQSLGKLYIRLGAKSGIERVAKEAGIDIAGPLAAFQKVASVNRHAFLAEEFLAHAEGQRAYEKLPEKIKRAAREFWGEFRDWLRASKFVRIAEALGAKLDDFTQSDLAWTLKGIRQQEAGAGSKAIRFMTAWHGSPHDHDGFSTAHIGTGEGAQAYGWGLYFAGAKEVAEFYRNKLSARRDDAGKVWPRFVTYKGSSIDTEMASGDATPEQTAVMYLASNHGSAFQALQDLRQWEGLGIPDEARYLEAAKLIESGAVNPGDIKADKGRLYQVDLKPAEDEYLLWDKPLSEQSEKVKEALNYIGKPDAFSVRLPKDKGGWVIDFDAGREGKRAYAELSRELGGDKAASEYLHSIGIRGIKYLDGSSRNRPLKEIKAEFLAELPEDADTAEVMGLIGTGRFSPKNEALIKALDADDWLGFDYPAQAISTALGNSLSNYDASPALMQAVSDAKDGGTHNYVIFDDADVTITTKESRALGAAESQSVKAIKGVIEQFKSAFKGAAALDIRVVQNRMEIPAAFRPSQYAEGVFHDDAGLIYLVADNITGKARAFQILLHEAVGHYGLAAMMGERFSGITKRVKEAARAKGEVKDDIYQPGHPDYATIEAVRLRYPDATENEIAQEVLARMAETDPGRTLFGYVRAMIRQWLRDTARALGIDLNITTAELNDLVALASAYMRRGDNLAEEQAPSGLVAASQKVGAGKTAVKAKEGATRNRTQAIAEALAALGGNPVVMGGDEYSVSKNALNKMTAEHGEAGAEKLYQQERIVAIQSLRELAEQAEVVSRQDDGRDPQVDRIVEGRAWITIDGSRYLVRILGKIWTPETKRANKMHSMAIEDVIVEKPGAASESSDAGSSLAGVNLGMDRVEDAGGPLSASATLGSSIAQQKQGGESRRSGMESRRAPPSQGPIWSALESSRADDVIYKMQDKHVDLKRVQQAIKDALGDIRDDIDAYLQEELFHGRAAKATEEFLERELNPFIGEMKQRGIDMETLENFLWARHAKERNAQIAKINPDMPDGGSGLTDKQSDALMAGKDVMVDGKKIAGIPQDKLRSLNDLAKKIDMMTAGNRMLLELYELETPETVAAWKAAYKHYVPLHREDADAPWAGNGSGQGYSVKGASTKRATGSFRPVENILANIAMQRTRTITRGEKNRVAQAMYGLAKAAPNPKVWEVDKAPTIRVAKEMPIYMVMNNGTKIGEYTKLSEAEKAARMGANNEIYQTWGERVVEQIDPAFRSRPNVVWARFGGEDKFIVFNEHNERAVRMAGSLKNLDNNDIGELMGEMARWTRYFAAINTQYNPVFGVVNLIRDVGTGMANIESTALKGQQTKLFANALQALPAIFKAVRTDRKGGTPTGVWAGLWEEFQEVGGKTGYRDMFRNSSEQHDALQNALDPTWWQRTYWGKTLTAGGLLAVPEQFFADKIGKPVFALLSDFNTMMENGVRLAAYKMALDMGMSKERAASLGKNLTVNFNRKGQITRQASVMYAFFNASVQGTARIAETLHHGAKPGEMLGKVGKQIILGGVMLGMIQAVWLMAAGFDDDDPPDFVKDRALILPIPFSDKRYLSLPLPLGFNILPAFGRIMTEFVLGGFKDPGKRITHMFDVLLDSTNPLGNSTVLQTIAPTVIDPIAALAENTDWSGKPIYREDFSKTSPTPGFSRTKDTATSLSKGLAWLLNMASGGTEFKQGLLSPTPDQIDYLLGQVTGGVGRELGKVDQTVSSLFTGEELPAYKIPLIGRLYGQAGGKSWEGSRFYDNLRAMNEHQAEIQGLQKTGRSKQASEYIKENPESIMFREADRMQRMVSQLQKRKRDLKAKDAPREDIRKVDDQITRLMRQFNQRVAQRSEQAKR